MSLPLIPITNKQAYIFAAFLVFYEFLTYIANDLIMPGMILVIKTFNAPESSIATSLTMYILGGASLQLILGPLSDRYGRRPIMLIGALLFFIFTLAIPFSQSIYQFLMARFFQGMGLCFIGVIGYTTLQEIFVEMDAVRLISLLANIATISPLLGPLVGAAYFIYFSWQSLYYVIGFLALMTFWGLWRFMPESVGVVQRDGKCIQPITLNLKLILRNYYKLVTNSTFMLGAFAIGVLVIPCLAWIAISPIMLITDAGFTIASYALFQIPVFGFDITGNFVLRFFTYRYSLKKIIIIGSSVSLAGLILGYVLVYFFNLDYIGITIGLSLYALGLGITAGPLSRQVLFCTPISKGTASALMSIVVMGTIAAGVEGINWLYSGHSNFLFSLYCVVMGGVYLISLLASRILHVNARTETVTD